MAKRGGGEIFWTQFSSQEQVVPQEQKDFLAGLSLLGQTFGDFHTGLFKTDEYANSIASQRRERQGAFLAFHNQMASALKLTKTLLQRVATMTQTDTLYVDTKEKRTPNHKKEYAFFISAANPHTSNVGQLTEGISIALVYSPVGKPEYITLTPREVRSVPEGIFDFMTRHNQDEHLALWQDRSLEAYVQVEAGRMPLSQSPAFEEILNTVSPRSRVIVEKTLRSVLRPTLPEATYITLTNTFDTFGTALLQGQDTTVRPQE